MARYSWHRHHVGPNKKVDASVATPALIGIVIFASIIFFVIFVMAVNSMINSTGISVKDFSLAEDNSSITLNLKLRNAEGIYYKTKYNNEKVLISPHGATQGHFQMAEEITIDLQDISTVICFEETISSPKPLLIKDAKTNEWRKANVFDKIKFSFDNMFVLT